MPEVPDGHVLIGRIEIQVTMPADTNSFEVSVSADGNLGTAEVVGYLELAKLQRVAMKQED